MALIAYFGVPLLLKKCTTDYAIPFVERKLVDYGVRDSSISFEKAHVSSYNSITWFNTEIGLTPRSEHFDEFGRINLVIDDFSITFNDFKLTKIELELRDFEVSNATCAGTVVGGEKPGDAESPTPFRMVGEHFRFPVAFDTDDPGSSLEKVTRELSALIKGARIETPFCFAGRAAYTIENKEYSFRFGAVRSEDGHGVSAHPDDIRPIAESFSDNFTGTELALVSDYPLRAIRLMQIKNSAESRSRAAYRQDARVPEDAYRHILWSYLLTKEYGGEFAQAVTDAHEEGLEDTLGPDKEMDYHNNRIGRRYADGGVAEGEILGKTMSDPDVIRNAQQLSASQRPGE
ncbi:MAG: hypothetical protein CMJ18_16340 [Phycisphaeraceae bacterium]|nr:hypothetical protein [Phycisphaeraceae bacterium]